MARMALDWPLAFKMVERDMVNPHVNSVFIFLLSYEGPDRADLYLKVKPRKDVSQLNGSGFSGVWGAEFAATVWTRKRAVLWGVFVDGLYGFGLRFPGIRVHGLGEITVWGGLWGKRV